jgi:hypothetical protein
MNPTEFLKMPVLTLGTENKILIVVQGDVLRALMESDKFEEYQGHMKAMQDIINEVGV